MSRRRHHHRRSHHRDRYHGRNDHRYSGGHSRSLWTIALWVMILAALANGAITITGK